MSTMDEIASYAKRNLSFERFNHVSGVVQTITELARIYGEDESAAKTAAWLHDVAREWNKERLLELADKAQVEIGFRSVISYGIKSTFA